MTDKNTPNKRSIVNYQASSAIQKRSSHELASIARFIISGFARGVMVRANEDRKCLFADYKKWLKAQSTGKMSNLVGTNLFIMTVVMICIIWLYPTFSALCNGNWALREVGRSRAANLFISELTKGNLLFLTLLPASIIVVIFNFTAYFQGRKQALE